MIRRFAVSALFTTAASAGVLAPVSLTRDTGIGSAAAECATCCVQPTATCVICGTEKCVAYAGYYEGKTGPNGCEEEQI